MEYNKFHHNIKPRFNNPTYNSNSVAISLGIIYKQTSSNYESGEKHVTNPNISLKSNNKIHIIRNNSESKLSNYGTRSLGTLPNQISDRDIYKKQQKQYNIISIQPIQHNQSIRKYPKLHLENQDFNFYKKIELENQYIQRKNNRIPEENLRQQNYKENNPEIKGNSKIRDYVEQNVTSNQLSSNFSEN